ncbi:hypothetical protein V1517DRAFT_180501 [Lipomyces orientalis]|uniref:Uncharacterized protein n=1 Tax=Lipomyces orientalis TaxID=1233043 RepID=A0ACC3TJ76_9ASCO
MSSPKFSLKCPGDDGANQAADYAFQDPTSQRNQTTERGYQNLRPDYIVVAANLDEYEIRTRSMESYPVRLDRRTCPCNRWYVRCIPMCPCSGSHIISRRDVVDFVDPCFKVESSEATYMHGIHAMPRIVLENDSPTCRPPTPRRPPGRRRQATQEPRLFKRIHCRQTQRLWPL